MGNVILVGAGPGDTGLLTLRGKQAIEQAEVVLYDRLVGEGILAMIPPAVLQIDVGKHSGSHPVPQEEINRLLLEHAQQGKRVVRLKGGDPYLFGRGAEELELLTEAGIAFEVVPGVTSALAVPAYAGIPVTHRDFCSSVHIITGHGARGIAPQIDYESLVRLRGTLVFMMGVAALPDICAGLREAGLDMSTPAALIENGTRSNQRKLVAAIGDLPEEAVWRSFHPPSVLIVGDVCRLSDAFDWFSRQPLHGMTVLVTRPKSAGGRLSALLREQGCGVIEYPCVRMQPVQQPLPDLAGYGWIVFTSAFGAQLFFQHLTEQEQDVRSLAGVKFAAIGSETARELTQHGIRADFVPAVFDAEHLADGLVRSVQAGEKVLLYRASAGTQELPATLHRHGIAVDDVAAYDTLYENAGAPRIRTLLEDGKIDLVTFTSASTVTGFVQSMEGLDFSTITSVCIGQQTARQAASYGMRVLVSEQATVRSMADLISQHAQLLNEK